MSQGSIDEIRQLQPWIRERAAQIERDRAVPEEVISRLAALGVFRLAARVRPAVGKPTR